MAEGGQTRDPSSHRTPKQITRQINGRNKEPGEMDNRKKLAKINYDSHKAGKSSVGDKKDQAHTEHRRNGGKTTKGNTKLQAQSKNRADNGSRGSVTKRVRGR